MLNRKERYDYKNVENTDTYNDKQKKSKLNLPLLILLVMILGIIAVVYIGQTVKITQLNYKAKNLEDELSQLQEKRQQLKVKTASESSLSNIEKIAKNKLNMVEPDNSQIIVLNNSNEEKQTEPQKDNGIITTFNKLYNKLRTVEADSP
ncbi:MAG: cell division protein FtsL [Bacillota bacterium]